MRKGIHLVRLILLLFPCIEGATRLNEYIHHYESLSYNPAPIHQAHLRNRRSLLLPPSSSSSSDLSIQFSAHSHNFRLRLRRDVSTFSDGVDIVGQEQPLDFSHLYEGEVEGVPGSSAFGSLKDGVFEGKVILPHETFYIERANKYPHLNSNDSSLLHSVIYSDRDVHDPYHHLRSGHAKGCGITPQVLQWMEEIQNSGGDDPHQHQHSRMHQGAGREIFYLDDDDPSYSMFSREHSPLLNASGSVGGKSRGRRATSRGSASSSRTTCTLSIQTDPLLWKHISEQEKTTDENKIREEILSLIAQHVKAVNHIYSNTLFDGKESYKNIRFEVQRIKIDTDKVCRPGYSGPEKKNVFCMENIDVSNFLNLHSLSDHEVFCLAYVFTYRDFTGGTLGLAWVASASGASGGVCEKYKTYTETIGGVYQSTKRSLNTGIITFVNYNSRVPPKVSQLTLAHEIGHNFGSPHDYPNKCRPGGTDGNYIMFASATSGDRPNNSKFSECSVRNISSVLDAIIHDSKKHNCFIATNGTFCGNKIVEEGEECDCGFTYDECEEKCCYPRQISDLDKKESDGAAQGCRRKPGFRCSPSEGPCCDQSCHFVQQAGVLCKQDTECSHTSYCSGGSAQCPTPLAKPNLTSCNDGTQVCQGGECRGSICLKYGLEECFLSSNDKNVDKRKLCQLACLGKDGLCHTTSELDLPGLPNGLSLRPGAPCDNFQGYCDVFLKCRAVDAEGPLARLKNLLFNKQTLLNIAQWVTWNWYYVLLMGVGFVVVMGLFIKCCAVHTPSSNPKKAPHLRIGDTLRRPISTLRRHRHYRAANSIPNGAGGAGAPSGAPPPYSAIAGPSAPPSAAPRSGPPHGFGEGRGPNRNRGGGRSGGGGNPYAGAYNNKDSRHAQHRV